MYGSARVPSGRSGGYLAGGVEVGGILTPIPLSLLKSLSQASFDIPLETIGMWTSLWTACVP